MLLRESSAVAGQSADLRATIGEGDGGGSVPHGAALVRFGEAVTRGSDDANAARDALRGALGAEGLVEAACIVAIFNGLVRTADSSGIPLDPGTLDSTVEFRAALALNDYGGAANTPLGAADPARAHSDPEKQFR